MRLFATIFKDRHNKYYFMTKSTNVIKKIILKIQISCSGETACRVSGLSLSRNLGPLS